MRHRVGWQLYLNRFPERKRNHKAPVVTGKELSATEINYLARRQDYLQTFDVVSGGPVLKRAGTRSVGGDIATQKAAALSWIGRIKE
jgi:hypothetical protein